MEPPSQKEIRELFRGDADFDLLRTQLVNWKNNGITQQQCYEALTLFPANEQLDEEADDLVRELMDIVSGFCSPHVKVWPAYLETP